MRTMRFGAAAMPRSCERSVKMLRERAAKRSWSIPGSVTMVPIRPRTSWILPLMLASSLERIGLSLVGDLRSHAGFGDHLVLIVRKNAGRENNERGDDRGKVVRRQNSGKSLLPEVEDMSGKHKITPAVCE